MSGHSKWSQIKRQKGVTDIKRGAMFTKLANAITIAVRAGGGIINPNDNFRLRLAIERARTANMPKENVERAIRRAAGKLDEGSLDEVVYEGFGPGGIAVIVECVTDNKQRTLSEVKSFFDKNGGLLGQPGTVSYKFKQVGIVTVKKDSDQEKLFNIAVLSGAQDLEDAGGQMLIYTNPNAISDVKEALAKNGLTVIEGELGRKPTITVPIKDKETARKVLSFVEGLESLEDVQKVYSNFDIPAI